MLAADPKSGSSSGRHKQERSSKIGKANHQMGPQSLATERGRAEASTRVFYVWRDASLDELLSFRFLGQKRSKVQAQEVIVLEHPPCIGLITEDRHVLYRTAIQSKASYQGDGLLAITP